MGEIFYFLFLFQGGSSRHFLFQIGFYLCVCVCVCVFLDGLGADYLLWWFFFFGNLVGFRINGV